MDVNAPSRFATRTTAIPVPHGAKLRMRRLQTRRRWLTTCGNHCFSDRPHFEQRMKIGYLSVVVRNGGIPGLTLVGGKVSGSEGFRQHASGAFRGLRAACPRLGPKDVVKVRPERAVHIERRLIYAVRRTAYKGMERAATCRFRLRIPVASAPTN